MLFSKGETEALLHSGLDFFLCLKHIAREIFNGSISVFFSFDFGNTVLTVFLNFQMCLGKLGYL